MKAQLMLKYSTHKNNFNVVLKFSWMFLFFFPIFPHLYTIVLCLQGDPKVY